MRRRMDHDRIRLAHLDRLTTALGPGHEQNPPRREQCVIDRAVLRELVAAVRLGIAYYRHANAQVPVAMTHEQQAQWLKEVRWPNYDRIMRQFEHVLDVFVDEEGN